jgi:hypothetical protein
MKIKELFDPNKDIYRTIEKVISFNISQEHRLKEEISEYIVTDSIEEQLEKLLDKMQLAMDVGGGNEVGVWVSGFYGSGKSSFTKYLGMAFDDRVQFDGTSFLKHLQNRLHKPQTKALLSTLAKRFPAAVVMLDLASEMLAGATMEEISTVLFYKVLHWAGYSRNLKVSALERRLQKDGRYDEFKSKIINDTGTEWKVIQNDPLVIDSLIPEIAHQMYPELFKTSISFSTEESEYTQFESERVQEMIDIVREATGKQYILFIIDEIGQYIGSRQNLILNLDGLSKNLKNIGGGKVWIIGTAQQTLTEDDPRASLNSPELYKLKDRFPIQIDLESSDIKEICYRRLLGKSSNGIKQLGEYFDQYGQALRHNTKLQDAKYYDADFNKESFVNLYPFLPAHFDILLHLLGALAKTTGGIGLRSAIKVIQDILIEGADGEPPVAEQPLGWLATTVTLYDTLEKDIQRSFQSINLAVGKVLIRFSDSPLHQEIAKTVAILQILGNLPVTTQNVASLMHHGVNVPSKLEEIKRAVDDLITDSIVPFGEKDNNLHFFSEKLNDIEQERAQIPLRTIETRRIFNESLREVFSPLPLARLDGALAVSSGLKVQSGTSVSSLAGERETIQTIIELSNAKDYDTIRSRIVDDSRHRSSQYIIYLLGHNASEMDSKVAEIYRCKEIVHKYRNEPDQEVKEYCSAQTARAAKLTIELQHQTKQCLARGSFVFRGQPTAVDSLDQDILEASKKHLSIVASQVYDRYSEAPVRAETALAERFLRAGDLNAVTSNIDPLGLVQVVSGTPTIKTDHKALVSIRDYIETNGTVEGKRLIGNFSGPPFGWSQDTLRYLIAILLVAGEIKLKVSGREIIVNGQQAIDALKTNNTFKPVGVALREGRPSNEVLARAAQRLTELLGDQVIPLEEEISKAVVKNFPKFQHLYASLAEKLSSMKLPGVECARDLNQEIEDILLTDASDASQRLGGEESELFKSLKWASEVLRSFTNGLENTMKNLLLHCSEIESLPDSKVPGMLRNDLEEEIAQLKERRINEDFYKYTIDFNTSLTTIQSKVSDAAINMNNGQKDNLKEAEQDFKRLAEWSDLTQEEQGNTLAQLEGLLIDTSHDLQGLKKLISQEYVNSARIREIKDRIIHQGQERRRQRLEDEKKKKGKDKLTRTINIPNSLTKIDQLNELIKQLYDIKNDLELYSDIEINIKFLD